MITNKHKKPTQHILIKISMKTALITDEDGFIESHLLNYYLRNDKRLELCLFTIHITIVLVMKIYL